MNCESKIGAYIDNKDWNSLKNYLETQKGYASYGRYAHEKEGAPYFNIISVCDRILKAKTPVEGIVPYYAAFTELGRLYEESTMSLHSSYCSQIPSIFMTLVYDMSDMYANGYSYRPTDRLWDCHGPSTYHKTLTEIEKKTQ